MILAVPLLAPLLLVLPAATRASARAARTEVAAPPPSALGAVSPIGALFAGWRADIAYQVRIEQHIFIRIPLRPPREPDMLLEFPRPDPRPPRMVERKMGDCVAAGGIAGMVIDGDKRLILYMRDSRMVSALLEKACRARDFYSGFYFDRQADGKLCAGRDTLLSRNGANCRLTRLRQLVAGR